jgi:3-deoxy-D-arabino-heptulosonate 7-phosphate (DAHP) synthase class II
MSPRHKKLKNSDFYESYEEFMIDYIKYMKDEDKRNAEIIRENKRDIQLLRLKLASE